jgi:hypothetical protein
MNEFASITERSKGVVGQMSFISTTNIAGLKTAW